MSLVPCLFSFSCFFALKIRVCWQFEKEDFLTRKKESELLIVSWSLEFSIIVEPNTPGFQDIPFSRLSYPSTIYQHVVLKITLLARSFEYFKECILHKRTYASSKATKKKNQRCWKVKKKIFANESKSLFKQQKKLLIN